MNTQLVEHSPHFVSTRNACKLCTPLGAALAFKGVQRCIALLHGSQGCATYIRRYMISHFREPVDIASSSFSEETAVFGGAANLAQALDNVIDRYAPEVIGVASTCLSETIGDDVAGFLRQYRSQRAGRALPALVQVSTASYRGTHADGYAAALRALVEQLSPPATPKAPDAAQSRGSHVNLLAPMLSPADLRNLKRLAADFGLDAVLLPDYSDTLDGAAWEQYHALAPGGTPVDWIAAMASAAASVDMSFTTPDELSAAAWLAGRGVAAHRVGAPIGVGLTDKLMRLLEKLSGRPTPEHYLRQRGRLLDSYVDAHKYVFEKRAVLYGEPDLVIALAALLCETGLTPVLCATGSGGAGALKRGLAEHVPAAAEAVILEDADFAEIDAAAETLRPEIVVGNSKGYKLARRLGVPLVRTGFPVHDRLGAARIEHLLYEGAQRLFDRIVNALLSARQDASDPGYTYL